MKKIISFIILAVIFTLSFQSVYAAPPITIKVGGKTLTTDVAPINTEGRILLPVRAVFEAIGAKVTYDAPTKTVKATKKDRTVSFVIGEKTMVINGEKTEIDVAATIKDNRTLVPLRACSEAFELEVKWNDKTRTASVLKETSVPIHNISEYTIHTYEYNEIGEVAKYESVSRNSYGGEPRRNFYEYTYDENGNCICTTEKDSEGVVIATRYSEYDEYGRKIKWDEYNNKKYIAEYDERGNKTYWGNADKTSGYYYEYNDKNLLTYEEEPKRIAIYTYNDYDQLVLENVVRKDANNLLITTEYTYYPDGRKKSTIGTNNVYNAYVYNDADNEVITYFADDSFAISRYDDNGNLIYRKEGTGSEKFYEYDEYGNVTLSKIIAVNGTVRTDTYNYTYDENGNLLKKVSSNGEWSEYTYDTNGNILSEKHSDGTSTEYIVIVK